MIAMVYTRLAACTRNSGKPCQRIARHIAGSSFMPPNVSLKVDCLLSWKYRIARNHSPVLMP